MATAIHIGGGGYSVGYEDGHSDGYASGHSDGYASGRADGYKAVKTYEYSWASSASHSGTSGVLDTGNTKAKTVYYTFVAINSGYTSWSDGNMQGSNDGKSWTTIDSLGANHTTSYSNKSGKYSYRFYRFTAGEFSTSWVGRVIVIDNLS